MKNNIYTAIYKTLVYSDVFGSPLTLTDLHTYLYCFKTHKTLLQSMVKTCTFVKKIGEYYVLVGRENIVKNQQVKIEESARKMKIAQKLARYLEKIPTILLIGVSGSVAVQNARKDADIDLLIITRSNSLWITRLFVTGVIYVLGRKRAVKATIAPDTVCTNMWMTESSLMLRRKNIFTAREVIQMKVLVDKNNTYARFLQSNQWVFRYFPNTKQDAYIDQSKSVFNWLFVVPNILAYALQKLYMRKKQTIETVTLEFAAFHPKDISHAVIKMYLNRLKTYNMNLSQDVSRSLHDRPIITPGS